MTLDYFAYWNGAQLRDLFEAIVAICSGPSYTGLLKSAALAGFLVTITGALLKWQGHAAKVFIFAMMLFYSLLFIPKVSIAVHDERAQSIHVIDNVPFGIGFFASTASHIGHWLTEAFEGAFARSDAERFSKFGAVYPQRLVSAVQTAGLVTPEGRARMNRFVSQCVVPELLDEPAKATSLAASGSIWSDITANSWLNPARTVLSDTGAVLKCPEAAADLDKWIQDEEVPLIRMKLGSRLVPDRLDPGAVIASSLPQAEALLLGLSRSMEESLKQSIMLEALPQGFASFSEQAGSPLSLAVNLSKAQGNLASEINYRTLSEIAKDALPKLRNAFEFIIIACFPLILIMVIAAGSGAGMILRSFFTLVIWIQLWAPISAVVNYLLITVDANPMNRIIAEFGGNTLMAADLIRQTGASSQALAGSLMLLVPVVAFTLAKSGEAAAASMVSSVLAPAQGGAAAASAQAASGNFTAGNVSAGNTSTNNSSSNKSDASSSFSNPYSSTMQTGYGTVTRDGDGRVTGMSRTPIDVGVSQSASMQESKNTNTGYANSRTLTSSEAARLTLSTSATDSDSSNATFSKELSEQLSKNQSLSETYGSSEGTGRLVSSGTVHSASESLQTSEGGSYASGFQAGATIGIGKGTAPSVPTEGLAGSAISASMGSGNPGSPASNVTASSGSGIPASSASSSSSLTSAGPASTSGIGTYTSTIPKTGKEAASGSSGKAGIAVEAGGKTGFSVQAAQSLIHQATGADVTADATTRTKAYNALNQAAEQVARNTSDRGVAQAARSFQAALTQAYQSASDKSFQSAYSQSSSQMTTRGTGASSMASVNHDAAVLNRVLALNGNSNEGGEEALEKLSKSRDFRETAVAFTAVENGDDASNNLRMGPSQIQEGMKTQDRLRREGVVQLGRIYPQNESHVNAKDGQNRDFVMNIPMGDSGLPTPETFQKEYEGEKAGFQSALTEKEGHVSAKGESTKKAVERYQKEEKGMSTVISIALAGGLGYKGPRPVKEDKKEEDKNFY